MNELWLIDYVNLFFFHCYYYLFIQISAKNESFSNSVAVGLFEGSLYKHFLMNSFNSGDIFSGIFGISSLRPIFMIAAIGLSN